MTKLMYLQNQDLFKSKAVAVATGSDDRGAYLVLDQTIFYPQGGGQPADQGEIAFDEHGVCKVYDVRIVDGEVRHYCEQVPAVSCNGLEVSTVIDSVRRTLNRRYHTAGHLLSAVAAECDSSLIAVKGHQFPGEAFIGFVGVPTEKESLSKILEKRIKNVISQNVTLTIEELAPEQAAQLMPNLPYELPKNKKVRISKIGDYAPVPCGGTHVLQLTDIGEVIIRKIKTKKGNTKISYRVE